MYSTGSVAGRAVLAVGLMIGFYVLAFGIAAVLAYLPIAELQYAHRIHIKLAIFCFIGAVTILWSIFPRWDRFESPGPALEPDQQPKLFSEIQEIAHATGQDMPSEVFLVGDVNAWVAQRGGVMGFFSRRVMGLGLPLLQILSVSELRAVLAHEFGHYYGGDTRLGPWVYKTRSAIGRTLGGLHGSVLQAPFLWYGNLFLRISHAVSRTQELSADALASRVVGSRPLVEGLKKLQAAAPAYGAYWSEELNPLLNAGFLPPIAEGFRRFTSEERVSTAMAGALQEGLETAQASAYDTHPPLPERIDALSDLPPGPDPSSEPPAISLLADISGLERRWLATVAEPERVEKLAAVEWESVVSTVFLPGWRREVGIHAAALEGATIADLGRVVAESRTRAERLPSTAAAQDSLDDRAAFVQWLASAGALLALERAGWSIESRPGAAVSARRNGAVVVPFDVVRSLAGGSLTDEGWRAECARLGIGGLSLSA